MRRGELTIAITIAARQAKIIRLHLVSLLHSINLRHEVVDKFFFIILMLLNLVAQEQMSVNILLSRELLLLFVQLPLFHRPVELVAEARGSDHRV